MTRVQSRLLLATLTVCLTVLAYSAQARPDSEQARAFVYGRIHKVVAILRARTMSESLKKAKLRRVLRHTLDIPTIGSRALGRHYRRASLVQRLRFLKALGDYLTVAYAVRLASLSSRIPSDLPVEKVILNTGTRPVGRNEIFVASEIHRFDDEPFSIDWRVRKGKAGLSVVDVKFMGISQTLALRREFEQIIRDRGIDGLIDQLQAITTRLRAKGALAGSR